MADCNLSDYIPSSCSPAPTDNDGLWTSWLVASEAFRFQVNKSELARSNAWRFYKAMKFLVDVTGVKGLPARSIQQINRQNENEDGSGWEEEPTTKDESTSDDVLNITTYGPNWHISTVKPGWIWKGDTSSDEVSIMCIFVYTNITANVL